MSARTVTLGGVQYPVGNFTIGQVTKIAPLLKQADDKFVGEMETVAQAQATSTIVWVGLQSGGYKGTYENFCEIRGVTKKELTMAQQEIGREIGAYKEVSVPEQPQAGEDQGDEGSPSAK